MNIVARRGGALGEPLEAWWQALAVGVGADRVVGILLDLRKR